VGSSAHRTPKPSTWPPPTPPLDAAEMTRTKAFHDEFRGGQGARFTDAWVRRSRQKAQPR
jgi:hypothetical protein